MTEITDLSTTDAGNTSISGEGVSGATNMTKTDNIFQNVMGLLARSIRTNVFRLLDNTDNTKRLAFGLSGITTGTTRTVTIPDKNGTLAMTSDIPTVVPPKGGIFGLTTSNNATDADHDIDILPGQAASDSATPVTINLNSSTTKRFDATFAEGSGNGGFASGESLPTSGTIHLWLIAKADGTADVFANNNATSGLTPTLPTGFTQKRRIASLRTDAAANIVGYVQQGNEFRLKSRSLDVDNVGNSAGILAPLSIPQGIRLNAHAAGAVNGPNTGYVLFSGADENNDTPSVTNHDLVCANTVAETDINFSRLTNTSAQIRYRTVTSSSITFFRVWSLGWTDITR